MSVKMNKNGFLSVLLYKLVIIINLINGKVVLNEKEKNAQIVDIIAVEGRNILLACPLSTPLVNVNMVLFFREKAGVPLYSFDVRDKNSNKAKHWSAPEVFGSRANYSIDNKPESLTIKEIKRLDEGIYRCRIDFRTSQTQSFLYNLSVIVLPENPVVMDRWGRQLNGTLLGPKSEGDDIVLMCRTIGGRPQPEVRWLINGILVDGQYEHNSGDVIENRLLWPAVQRSDLHSIFTCQAINYHTKLVEPKEISFVLEMHLKPLTINIINSPANLIADRRYEINCESYGSRPNAIITWYKGRRQLRRTKDDILNNTTRSELSFVPMVEDDGKFITCRAENPSVNGLFLETTWKLNVVYAPIVTLQLGSTLLPDNIKEDDDVYFECQVQANPAWRKLLWLKDGVHLLHNASARIIRSNQSLVLQKVSKGSVGNYACSALNEEGETVSNQLSLRVKYAPICDVADKIILVGAKKDENIEIICNINADPPAKKFRWKFNNSGEILFLDTERFSKNGTRSVLHYTPVSDQDFGTLSCWGINEIGEQLQPCLFQVVLAVVPSSVNNCTVSNQTVSFAEIQCIGGYDGGLSQIFVLEMISKKTKSLRFNFTNLEEPSFSVELLDELNKKMIEENDSLITIVYAVNQKGKSSEVIIHQLEIGANYISFKDNFLRTNISSYTPYVFGFVITLLILCLLIIFKITVACLSKKSKSNTNAVSSNGHLTTAKLTNHSNNLLIISNHKSPVKMNGNTDSESIKWQSPNNTLTRAKTKGFNELLDDELDPDVIQFKKPSSLTPLDLKNDELNKSHVDENIMYKSLQNNNIEMKIKSPIVNYNNSMSIVYANHPMKDLHIATTSTTTFCNPKSISLFGNGLDVDINSIKELLLNRVPESCV